MPVTASRVSVAAGDVDLPLGRHDVRLLADVDDERFAVEADDGLEERGDEAHGVVNSVGTSRRVH